jgi:hypothetical protein
MKATLPTLSVLLVLVSACGGKSAQAARVLALAQQVRAQTGFDAGALSSLAEAFGQPQVKHRSPDSLDPMLLLAEADVIAILKQRGACGDGTATAVWQVTMEKVERPEYRGTGTATAACKVKWSGVQPGEQYGAQGDFAIQVVDVPTFDMFRNAAISRPLPGVGDDAYLCQGQPYVRVGDLALTIENSSSSSGLSAALLKAACQHMPK